MGGHHQCLIPLWLSVLTFFSMMEARFCQDKVVPQGSTTRVECTIVPPGLSKLVNGVDITMLDLTPLDFTSADGYKSPVISFTCDDGRELVKGEQRYQQPDQIWQYVDNPGGWLTTDVHLSKTSSDVRSSLTKQVGGEGAIWKFAFSASKSYSKMQRSITNATRYISEVSSYHSSSRVYVLPSWLLQLNRVAKLYIRRYIEGKTYKSDPQAYQGFINLFGTHYFSVANFGGHIRMIQETKSSYFLSHTDQDVKINAKASLAKFLSANGGRASSSTTVNTQFAAASIETVSYYGGSTNLLSTNGVQNWQPTVDEKPWLFSGALKPLSHLIKDDTQRSSMEQAVLQHVLRSYLVELRRLVSTLKAKVVSSAGFRKLEERLAAMEALPLGSLKEANVNILGQDINRDLTVPRWFTHKTNLCFRWRPDGNGGQCGGGAARLLCAQVGRMTAVYRDDTDRRGGGCRMQWSIQSSGFDSWFSQVQVCYRWYPDGDGGQCGGGAGRLLCAPVNHYSAEYRDDTDRRGGGCQMSWRIVVPDSAPLWMKATKLCFSWYPDGNSGQCGPAPSRYMCAVANQWTPFYRDDTDKRAGGCGMSWGIKLDF